MNSSHPILVTHTNATSFERFCCFSKELNHNIKGDVVSIPQLMSAVKVCFADLDLSPNEQLKIIFKFSKGIYPYKEENCSIDEDPCSAPTTLSHVAYICLWFILLLLTLTSNFTVIMAVHKVPFLRESSGNIFISSLAFSDMLVGIFIIPIKIGYAYNNLNFCIKTLCRFYITMDTALFSTSITNLFVISIDRHFALNYPYKYHMWMTTSKSKYVIVGIWIFGCAWGLLSNFDWNDIGKPSFLLRSYQCLLNNSIYITTVYVLVFYIPAIAMALIYSRIYFIARRHARAISESFFFQNNNAESCSSSRIEGCGRDIGDSRPVTNVANGHTPALSIIVDSNHVDMRRSSKALQMLKYRKTIFKASKTVATVYGTFFVCWFPVSALSLALAFCRDCFDGTDMKWFYIVFVEVLPVFNSMMNPFIYAIMNKQYRKAYKSIFIKLKLTVFKRYFVQGK